MRKIYAKVNAMVGITSNHINFIVAIDYRGSVATGDFGLHAGKKVIKHALALLIFSF